MLGDWEKSTLTTKFRGTRFNPLYFATVWGTKLYKTSMKSWIYCCSQQREHACYVSFHLAPGTWSSDCRTAFVSVCTCPRTKSHPNVATFLAPRGKNGLKKMGCFQIRPHRRCWGVIVRKALVKGYRFTWGGGPFSGQNLLFLIGRDARLQKTL